MVSFQAFIATNTGKPNLGDTSQNIGQCVGLIELWIDNLGLNHDWGNAIDLLTDADTTQFTIIYNNPNDTTQYPPDGAIVVLGKPYGLLADGTYAGHTGISVGSTGTELSLFEQNDPEGSTPQIKKYSYAFCVGWIIPKQGGDSMANMYGSPNQYDLNNPESMKVAVDVLNRLQTGQLIDKSKYDADLAAAKSANNGNQDVVNKYNQLKQDFKDLVS